MKKTLAQKTQLRKAFHVFQIIPILHASGVSKQAKNSTTSSGLRLTGEKDLSNVFNFQEVFQQCVPLILPSPFLNLQPNTVD